MCQWCGVNIPGADAKQISIHVGGRTHSAYQEMLDTLSDDDKINVSKASPATTTSTRVSGLSYASAASSVAQRQTLLSQAGATECLPADSHNPNSVKKSIEDSLVTLHVTQVPKTINAKGIKSLISHVYDVECVDAWMTDETQGGVKLTLTGARTVLLNPDKLSSFKIALGDVYKMVYLKIFRLPVGFDCGHLVKLLPIRLVDEYCYFTNNYDN